MRSFFYPLLGLCFLIPVAGCATSPGADHASWVAANGGIAAGEAQQRVERAADRLCGACTGRVVRVRVLNSPDSCAYGWPDGSIYLSRGLIDRLDDDELAAAIAHELGHLLLDGHLRSVVSLTGCGAGADVESRADRAGVRLLESRQIPVTAMARMLEKLAAPGDLPARTREAVRRRAGQLAGR